MIYQSSCATSADRFGFIGLTSRQRYVGMLALLGLICFPVGVALAQRVTPVVNGGGGKVVPAVDVETSASSVSYGTVVTLSVVVAPSACGANAFVRLTDNGAAFGSISLNSSGTGAITANLATGSHSIVAAFGGGVIVGNTTCVAANSTPCAVTVSPSTPTVYTWPTASTIAYPQELASSALSGGNASVPGSFAWVYPTTASPVGSASWAVTFTPSDSVDYSTVSGWVSVFTNPGTPSINAWPRTTTITYGQTLASSTLFSGSASVAGSFAWTAPGTIPNAGNPSESVIFTPSDSTDYYTVTGSLNVTVNKGIPQIAPWPTAGAITYGQTLASSTLTGGTASVDGSFSWTTPSTSPDAGSPLESMTFTPTDSVDYNTELAWTTVTVNQATPTLAISSSLNPSPHLGSVTFTATISNGRTGTITFYDSGVSIGTGTIGGTTASLTTSGLSIGVHPITASWPGDADYVAVTSGSISQSVAPVWDNGAVTLNLTDQSGNSVFTQTATYGAASTPSSVAAGLAGSNANVRVTASSGTLSIQALGTGASTNYSYAVTSQSNAGFNPPSFAASQPTGRLSGGADPGASRFIAYSYRIADPSGNSGYDSAGNVTAYSDLAMGSWRMSYDSLNRLTGAQNLSTTSASGQYANNSVCLAYDSFGNRTTESEQAGPCPAQGASTFVYNADNQVSGVIPPGGTQPSPSPYVYERYGSGTIVVDATVGNQYLYDGEDRLCAVSSPAVGGGTTMTGYVYDADGNRVAKGTITSWSCDASSNGLLTAGNETAYLLGLGGEQVSELAQNSSGSMQWQRTYAYAVVRSSRRTTLQAAVRLYLRSVSPTGWARCASPPMRLGCHRAFVRACPSATRLPARAIFPTRTILPAKNVIPNPATTTSGPGTTRRIWEGFSAQIRRPGIILR